MYTFPKGLYADVRLETTRGGQITYQNGTLTENRDARQAGAMVRVFDGTRWYNSAVTDVERVQEELDSLAAMAAPNPHILDHPLVRALEVNRGRHLRWEEADVDAVTGEEKLALAAACLPVLEEAPALQSSAVTYADGYTVKRFLSSLGADVTFDTRRASLRVDYTLLEGAEPDPFVFRRLGETPGELAHLEEALRADLEEAKDYARRAVPVAPGKYPCILSPLVAGVFAHESFGHKSEADFMIGDETMKREWAMGSVVGAPILNIYDDGSLPGNGYTPFDDEGTAARRTYLIREGKLAGRLHSAATAADLGEGLTGNARAMNFLYPPIVRMTATCIGPGEESREELFAGVEEGVYIADFWHGSGMSTFTIAPSRAWMIRGGKLAEPVRVSVVTGNVMETLHLIDGLSRETDLGAGGCGKMEQMPLPVSMGGPYVRVKELTVR